MPKGEPNCVYSIPKAKEEAVPTLKPNYQSVAAEINYLKKAPDIPDLEPGVPLGSRQYTVRSLEICAPL